MARCFLTALLVCLGIGPRVVADPPIASQLWQDTESLVGDYCLECHHHDQAAGGIDLEAVLGASAAAHRTTWERVYAKLQARQMPPMQAAQPAPVERHRLLRGLDQELTRLAQQDPYAGQTETLRRLTRTEYRHAIRDLLSLEIDVTALLPPDEVSHGFDNITLGTLSPTLIQRYIGAAQKISRLAMGRGPSSPDGKTVRAKPDVTQEGHVPGLPLGTRGGMIVPYQFPQAGEYEVRVRLTRDRNEHVEGLREPHELDVLLDSALVRRFTVRPPKGNQQKQNDYEKPSHTNVDRHLVTRFSATAGRHVLGVTFVNKSSSLEQTKRQPLNVHYNMYRHPRLTPAIYQVTITGPFPQSRAEGAQPQVDSASRQQVLIRVPGSPDEEEICAREILSHLLRRACRQPVNAADLERLMAIYRQGRAASDFENGIELALGSVLVHPKFLFRVEQAPAEISSGQTYPINDIELASRLSFFLWSSIPDEELLAAAESGRLRDPATLRRQTLRMLADARSQTLATNFASQWLYLRNLESITPDSRLYPDFDDNLRQAFRRETELFVQSIWQEDRSVLDALRSDYTFLNERLAKHYGIPHVYGSRFRRVAVSPQSRRGGLLRHGSILTVTSYATRTSPVIRGKWILENLLGTPPPPPPPDVPDLADNTVSAELPMRQRLAAHRENPTCARCHDTLDPLGFALENFDAVGRWRDREGGQPVDARGRLPGGSRFDGVAGLEQGLLNQPEQFVGTLVQKLLTYATGRGYHHLDGATVRHIVRAAAEDDYRFSTLILGIVQSTPFLQRTAP